jgi:ElaB/YqjD/DUF883 family membrane-anchored ribosome-binding protein
MKRKISSGEKVGSLLSGFAKDIALNRISGYPDKEKIQEYLSKKVKEINEDLMEESSHYTKEEKQKYKEYQEYIEKKKKVINEVTEKFSKTFQDLAEKRRVDHPNHYGGDKPFEVIKVLEAWNLDFHLGNVVKYVYRAGIKDVETEIEDLEKAKWYLQRKIDLLKKSKE